MQKGQLKRQNKQSKGEKGVFGERLFYSRKVLEIYKKRFMCMGWKILSPNTPNALLHSAVTETNFQPIKTTCRAMYSTIQSVAKSIHPLYGLIRYCNSSLQNGVIYKCSVKNR